MSDELDDEFDYDASVRDDEVESAKQSPSVNPSVERYNVDKEGRQRLGKRRRVQGTTGKGQHLSNHDQLDLTGSLPKLVVLDLDKTLWPFYCHEQTTGPYSRVTDSDNCAVRCRSSNGLEKIVRLFPEVMDILDCLKQQGTIRLAVASRSPLEGAARGILGALGMLSLFCCLEIHRGSKATHFENIATATGLPYRDMIFFDDDNSNIRAVSKLGVCCMEVSKQSGLTFDAMRSGLKKYREACLSRSSMRAWLQGAAPNNPGRKTAPASSTDGGV